MKIVPLSAAFVLMTALAASGDEVPFASPSPSRHGADVVSLGDIMALTQLRHIKLWYAGKSKDWALVNYEIDRISESLVRAALLYANIPIEYIQAVAGPMADLRDAAAAKNADKFVRSYSDLTSACNSCHVAGAVGFIRMQPPTSSTLTDEAYGRQ
jgi:hypothetical protein